MLICTLKPCKQTSSYLQVALRQPLNPIESISAALGTHLRLKTEARPTVLALVWMGFVTICICEYRFDASQCAHCEPSLKCILTSHVLKDFPTLLSIHPKKSSPTKIDVTYSLEREWLFAG
jgi:hypothetical protein